MSSFILGKCKCGCGTDIPIRPVKNQYGYKRVLLMYVKGHSKFKHDTKGKINIGYKNSQWKGDNVGIRGALHRWIRSRLKQPEFCQLCGIKPPYDLANKTGMYYRHFSNWYWLCRSCHMNSDGRINNLRQYASYNSKDR